jgi:hypothetical protein
MCRPEITDQAAISQVDNRSSLGMVGEQDLQRRIAAAIIPPISPMIRNAASRTDNGQADDHSVCDRQGATPDRA